MTSAAVQGRAILSTLAKTKTAVSVISPSRQRASARIAQLSKARQKIGAYSKAEPGIVQLR